MSVKLILTGRRRPGQTPEAHRRHMHDMHGRLVLDYIAADPGNAPRRYVQNHVLEASLSPGRDFVTELSFPDAAAIDASRQTEFYLTHLMPDEPNMVDPASVIGMVTREEPALTGPGLGFKVIFLHRAAPGLGREAFEAGWAALDTPWPRSRSHVLSPGPIDGMDAVRLPTATAASEFASSEGRRWRARLAAAGLIAEGSSDLLIAREHVLFDGPLALAKGTLA
jgi:hypothetical protein